jgi:hypothetical protein
LAIAMDFKGNLVLLGTSGGGGSTAVSGSTGPYLEVTNAPSVSDLEGPNVQVGGQIGEGATINTEIVFFQGSGRTGLGGISISPGFGLIGPWPFELHGTATGTTILASLNVPDLIVAPFRP